jgi:Transposase DDE domain
MDRESWRKVLDAVKRAARSVEPTVRCPLFGDWLIVAMYFWTCVHDRPQCWACDREHYGRLFRPRKLPSVSQFNRRVKTASVKMILQRVHNDLAKLRLAMPVSFADGKPLLVSPVSKDPDARCGHVTGGFGKGYKLHAIVTEDKRIVVWSVTALNVHETHVARMLCGYLPPQLPNSLMLADGNYDDADFHKSVEATGSRLLVPLRGMAEHPVTLRQMGAARREHIKTTREQPDLVNYMLNWRTQIERVFSALTCYGGGLGPLPSWVRRLERVARWVGCKIAMYHARLQCQNPISA